MTQGLVRRLVQAQIQIGSFWTNRHDAVIGLTMMENGKFGYQEAIEKPYLFGHGCYVPNEVNEQSGQTWDDIPRQRQLVCGMRHGWKINVRYWMFMGSDDFKNRESYNQEKLTIGLARENPTFQTLNLPNFKLYKTILRKKEEKFRKFGTSWHWADGAPPNYIALPMGLNKAFMAELYLFPSNTDIPNLSLGLLLTQKLMEQKVFF